MTTVSWFYDKSAPLRPGMLATQSTAFASSSLASRSQNALTYDKGTGIYTNFLATRGTPHANVTIYDDDKSPLGVEYARRRPMEDLTPLQAREMHGKEATTPNEQSLKSSYTLKPKRNT